jgi:hypothetical protein
MKVQRDTVDLSGFPELVVIYLGIRANQLKGLGRILGLGRQIQDSVAAKPDGLLKHEPLLYSLFPLHLGMRQYWRDFESMERWTRQMPHQQWWKDFLKESGGVGFWHETYLRRGGVECVFDDIPAPVGLLGVGTRVPAKGPMYSARGRGGLSGDPLPPAVNE